MIATVSYTTRVLPSAEWSRLDHTDLATLLPYLDERSTQVVVVEDGDRIVGCWAATSIVHLEGVWIDAAHRGRTSVARRLLRATTDVLRAYGCRWVWTGAADDTVRRLLRHFGAQPMPIEPYVISVEALCLRQ